MLEWGYYEEKFPRLVDVDDIGNPDKTKVSPSMRFLALDEIAELALLRGTGARGLRAILEEVLLNVMYEVPGRTDLAKVVITGEVVRERVNPTLVPRTAPKRAPREKTA